MFVEIFYDYAEYSYALAMSFSQLASSLVAPFQNALYVVDLVSLSCQIFAYGYKSKSHSLSSDDN